MLLIRQELPRDCEAVAAVNNAAFEGPVEATIVDKLRHAPGSVSLVAEVDRAVVGHLLLSRVGLDGAVRPCLVAALGPMAVDPGSQRAGVGSGLVRQAIASGREHGYGGLVLVGHAHYYPRFGFRRASSLGLRCEFEVPDEAFMAIELEPGALEGVGGIVRFAPAFHEG